MSAKISQFTIRLVGLVFLIFGLACTVAPAEVIHAATGAFIAHPIALTDLRATYGGMSIGVAVILFFLASSPTTTPAGLVSVFAIMLGMAGGRLVGLATAPATNGVMLLYLLLEILTATVAGILLRTLPRTGEH